MISLAVHCLALCSFPQRFALSVLCNLVRMVLACLSLSRGSAWMASCATLVSWLPLECLGFRWLVVAWLRDNLDGCFGRGFRGMSNSVAKLDFATFGILCRCHVRRDARCLVTFPRLSCSCVSLRRELRRRNGRHRVTQRHVARLLVTCPVWTQGPQYIDDRRHDSVACLRVSLYRVAERHEARLRVIQRRLSRRRDTYCLVSALGPLALRRQASCCCWLRGLPCFCIDWRGVTWHGFWNL